MPALGLEHAVLLVVRCCCLCLSDGRCRLEGYVEVDWCAVCDAALDAARVVGLGGETEARDVGRWVFPSGHSGSLDESVVVNGAW